MGLIELVKACGALNIACTLIEGAFARTAGGQVFGKAAINAKAAGYTAARAGGLADVWLALSRFEEADIAQAVIDALAGEEFAGAVNDRIRERCLADAARFTEALGLDLLAAGDAVLVNGDTAGTVREVEKIANAVRGARKHGIAKTYAVELAGGEVEWFTSGYLSLPAGGTS